MMRTSVAVIAGAAALLTACSSSSHSAAPPVSHRASAAASSGAVGAASVSGPVAAASPTAAPVIPDACSLLTRAEAQVLAGVRLQAGEDTKAAGADNVASCTYNAPTTGPSGSISVFAQLAKPDALTTDQNLGHKFRSVAGVGDQALQEVLPATMFVRKGRLWVSISSAYSVPAGAMVTAARLAAARVTS